MAFDLGDKLKSPEECVKLVKSGDRVYIGSNCGEPQTLVQALFDYREALHGVDIVHLLTHGVAPYADPQYAEHFRHQAFFIGKNVRAAVKQGAVDYIPVFLGEIPALFKDGQLPIDVALIQVTPPDEFGFVSMGISVDIGMAACKHARYVIAEINPDTPRTLGNSFLHVNEIDAFCMSRFPIIEHSQGAVDDTARAIARYIADLIPDGATLQAGIGAIPDAVMALMGEKNDLGMHTEMFSDGILPLVKNGNLNCRRKTLHPGKIVSTFCMGSMDLYRFIDDNPLFEFHPSEYVNDPFVIAQNERMISVNGTLEVDLTGQVVSDSIGHTFFSGFGGQVDFVRGAARSKGGKPIIALPSTAKSGTMSRIKSTLTPGAGVVTSRADVHYVATEYGVAYLHGKPVRERALSLIRIAHPDFRDQLLEEAKEIGYIPRSQPSLAHRYPDEWVKRVQAPNGDLITIRPILPTDESKLKEHFYSLGEVSLKRRFGTVLKALPTATITELVNVDFQQHVALVATIREGEGDKILVVARYYVNMTTNYAEMAMAVRDDYQGQGLGRLVFQHLLEVAQAQKLRGVVGWVQADNAPMLKLLLDSGFDVETKNEDGQLYVTLTFAKTRRAGSNVDGGGSGE
ncbi:MAG: GNAT family N-acetyltransferase [Fimbriimonadaceae bacterium]